MEAGTLQLGIPRELVGLSSYGPDGTYCGKQSAVDLLKEVREGMLRRHVLALGGVAAFGATIKGLGEFAELTGPASVPLPSRIFEVHVSKVHHLTRSLREAARVYGSEPQVSSAAAGWATRLLGVPGAAPVQQALLVAVAGLQLEAGWAGFDAGLYEQAMYHYGRGLELATEAGDAYLQILALNCAGLTTIEHGHPNDGLKMLQCGQVTLSRLPLNGDRGGAGEWSRSALQACGLADSATALAALGQGEAAYRYLGQSRELWQPTRSDPSGDLDIVPAHLELGRGRLDVAEQFATASLRRWESGSPRARTRSGIVLATIHVRAGEPDGPELAHRAITSVTRLSSVRARRRLAPLAAALEARPGSDTGDLARMARQVATSRA